jgi:3-oxoacyl-[acyl-carrier protein] reductase
MTLLLDLSGRVAVVTGAGGGIGAGIADRLESAGAAVVRHRGRRDGDLLRPGVADELAERAVDEHGRLDVWVSNAGVQPVAHLLAMDGSEFAEVLDGNVTTVFHGTQAAARHMTGGGAIVNVASIEALQPAPGHSHYAAAKAAVVAHTRAAALELGGRGIRVNAVCPGLIERPGIAEEWPDGVARWEAACPLGRLGRPDDVGDACAFLASDLARWVTGAVLVVDGGMLVRPGW